MAGSIRVGRFADSTNPIRASHQAVRVPPNLSPLQAQAIMVIVGITFAFDESAGSLKASGVAIVARPGEDGVENQTGGLGGCRQEAEEEHNL